MPLSKSRLEIGFCVFLVSSSIVQAQLGVSATVVPDAPASSGFAPATAGLTNASPLLSTETAPLAGDAPRLAAEPPRVVSVRSREIELHYQVSPTDTSTEVELWYTRDRGTSWQSYGKDEDHTSPLVFTAPSEGLYGFLLIAHVAGQPARPAPRAYEAPQRWVFIDATPPLAQWDGVQPAEDFATSRVLQLRWTAHDDNFGSRPVSLSYQSSLDQNWTAIDTAVANTGVYDWRVPESVSGRVTVKLIVRDQGGHTVERTFGPISLDKYASLSAAKARSETPTSRPALATSAEPSPAGTAKSDLAPGAPTTRPETLPRVDLLQRRMAADLYRQGSWHLVRGQYGVAAERLREALEHDPDLLEARHDLAGIFYRQQDYDRAIAEYQAVLERNANYESALYGAALAYVAKRDYHRSREMLTRLLKVNDRNAEAWLDLGDVLFMTGDVINARANWRQAMKLDPSATELISKAKRRLELYGSNDEVSSTHQNK